MELLNSILGLIRGEYPSISISNNKKFCEITMEANDKGGARRFSQQRIDRANLLSAKFSDELFENCLKEQVRTFNKDLNE